MRDKAQYQEMMLEMLKDYGEFLVMISKTLLTGGMASEEKRKAFADGVLAKKLQEIAMISGLEAQFQDEEKKPKIIAG